MNAPYPMPSRPLSARTIGGVSIGAIWKWGRWVLGLGLVALAVWAVEGRSAELSGASDYLANLNWPWVVLAGAAEVVSYLSFAAMQRRLLEAGRVSAGMGALSGVTFAGNSIQNTLPGGVVLAAAFAYRQYRRYGADEVLAGWVIVAMAALSIITLSGLATAGLAVAASRGNAYDLASVIIGVLVIAALVMLAWVKRDFLIHHSVKLIRLSQRLTHRPHGEPRAVVSHALGRLAAVAPNRRQWAFAMVYAAGNWVLDCLCLVLALVAVGAPIPWSGVLLAYSAAQLATNLPVTPGGLGVVEGSMTVALVAFGGGQASTVAAVLLYRILSFWLLLPVGWGLWAGITFRHRHTPLPEVAP